MANNKRSMKRNVKMPGRYNNHIMESLSKKSNEKQSEESDDEYRVYKDGKMGKDNMDKEVSGSIDSGKSMDDAGKNVENDGMMDSCENANEDVNNTAEILDTNPQLFFHLQQQRLIELIREGQVAQALEFAQEELAPRGEENPSFLEELERTVALLAFEDVKNSPVGDLLDLSHRSKVASEVNAAILTSQGHEKDLKLPSLLRMLLWAQNQLDEKAVYPRITDLFTAALEDPSV